MFTGLIGSTGTVTACSEIGEARRIVITSDPAMAEIVDGESLAVDGVCLTVRAHAGGGIEAEIVAETLARTTLGRLAPGSTVHLERAIRVNERLGGHLVSGHVDAAATVIEVRPRLGDHRLRIELPDELARLVPRKGSIAVNGVSLTVAAVDSGWFEVALVPETLLRTRLGRLAAGDRVNVEADLLARYLDRLMDQRAADCHGAER